MIEDVIEKIEQLPPIPTTIKELQDLYYYDDYNTSDVEKVLNKDPNLVANILKIANSPYYGLPREFNSIRQAIAYFGLEQIIEFAIATFVNNIFTVDLHFYQINTREFMLMSQLKGKIARSLIQEKGQKALVSSTAFLSDVSKVIIANFAKEKQLEPLDPDTILNEIDNQERSLFGFDTIDVSVKMFEYWNFDLNMIELLQRFKERKQPSHEALFVSRDLVTVNGKISKDQMELYPQYKDIIDKIVR